MKIYERAHDNRNPEWTRTPAIEISSVVWVLSSWSAPGIPTRYFRTRCNEGDQNERRIRNPGQDGNTGSRYSYLLGLTTPMLTFPEMRRWLRVDHHLWQHILGCLPICWKTDLRRFWTELIRIPKQGHALALWASCRLAEDKQGYMPTMHTWSSGSDHDIALTLSYWEPDLW